MVTLVSEKGKKVLNLLFARGTKKIVYLVYKTIICILYIDNNAEKKLLSYKLFHPSCTIKNSFVQL